MAKKGIIFLDPNYQVIPYRFTNYDEWIKQVNYIFIDDEWMLVDWSGVYTRHEGISADRNPFKKTGAYMWDDTTESWVHIWDKITDLRERIGRISSAFIKASDIPMFSKED